MTLGNIKVNPIARAMGIFGVVAALVTGITYAALTSQATLTGNTLSSANSSLLIWDGAAFASTAQGFDVTGLIPGTQTDENAFYLKNAGDSDMDVSVKVPTAPLEPVGGYDFTGWENLKVRFTSNAPGCADPVVDTDMGALLAGDVDLPCNPLSEGAQGDSNNLATEGNYSVSYKIESASVTGDSPGVGDFDFVFTGTAVASEL